MTELQYNAILHALLNIEACVNKAIDQLEVIEKQEMKDIMEV